MDLKALEYSFKVKALTLDSYRPREDLTQPFNSYERWGSVSVNVLTYKSESHFMGLL